MTFALSQVLLLTSFRVLTAKSQLLFKVQKNCRWQVRIIAKVKRNNSEMPGKRKSEQEKYNFLGVLHSKESIGVCFCRRISRKLTQSLIWTNTSLQTCHLSSCFTALLLYCFACCSNSFLYAVREDSYLPTSHLNKPSFNGSHQPFREHHINLGSAKIFRSQISEASSKMKISLFNYSLPSLNILCFVVSDYSILLWQGPLHSTSLIR